MLMAVQEISLLIAIATPPPRASLRSFRKRVKLGRSARTSWSLMSLYSHVSVNTNKLLLDDETRLEITSRLGRKLRMLVKITDNESCGRGAGLGR